MIETLIVGLYLADMLLHPFECLALILQSIVQTRALRYFFGSQKSIWSDAVVEGDHNNVIS